MNTDLQRKAESGNAEAQRQLGDKYFNGESGYIRDYTKAAYWYRKAAEQGVAEAQYSIGRCYELGAGVKANPSDAVMWYRMAAGKGHPGAQCNLGICYATGNGVTRDYSEANYWFRKSAEKGDAEGQHNLADNFLRGQGVTQNFTEAVNWFTKSAEQGHAGSQFFLGWCYQNGKGVPLNTQEAISWYRKAAAQGHVRARDALTTLSPGDANKAAFTGPQSGQPGAAKEGSKAGAKEMGEQLLAEVDRVPPDTKAVTWLIEQGAAFDARDEKGRTPLILAAWRGYTEIVKALIKAKAPLNEKDSLGNTALIFAAWQGHADATKALIDAGAMLNEKNQKGYTAIVCAASNGRQDVARMLAEAGAVIGDKELAFAGEDAQKLQELARNARKAQRSHERILKRLDVIIGQQEVKNRIGGLLDRIELDRARAKYGIPSTPINLHMAFTGSPGTGKTTVARILGDMFRDGGLLSKGHTVEASPADILGVRYVGEAAQKMASLVDEARGGVLFIDEAYNFTNYKGARSDVSAEATDVLLRAMEGAGQDLMVILAGYEDEIRDFLSQNPGMKSRIQTFIPFASYSAQELTQIYAKIAEDGHYVLGAGCDALLKDLMPLAPDKYSRTFGNARYVRNLFDETLKFLGSRIAEKEEPSKEDVTTILPEDIRAAFDSLWSEKKKTNLKMGGISVDLPPVTAAGPPSATPRMTGFQELEGLIGLQGVKESVRKTAYEMQFFKKRDTAGLPVARSSRHFVFSGNPGTGKTTVARIFGRILKEIGYLEQGHVIETQAMDLIAEYVGQTAPKVASRVADAMGGILFIDEAYALLGHRTQGGSDFGQEAVSTLLKLMEDYRDRFVVIAAGYPKEMLAFVEANPGLKSRFTDYITFDDYTPAELEQIYMKLASDMKYTLADGAEPLLKQIMEGARDLEEGNFSNGRFVRNLFEDTIKNLAERVLSQGIGADIKDDAMSRIEKPDLQGAYDEACRVPVEEKSDFGFRVASDKT